MFFEGFNETPPGIFVNGSVLEELFADDFAVYQAGGRDILNIDLKALTGIAHLFIWLRDVFRIRRFDDHDPMPAQDAVKPSDRTFVAALHKFDPEYDQTGMGVSAAHIEDELEFFRRMLVRMTMGTSGAITQGVQGAIKAFHPAIDILSVDLITNSSLSNAMFLSETN